MDFFERQKILFSLYDNLTEDVRKKYSLTRADFDVLMFLFNNPRYNTAAQIVKYRKIVKSQVSCAVSELVARGYITTAFADGNNKTIHLSITHDGRNIAEEGRNAQKMFADVIFGDFSDSEIETVKSFFHRVLENAEHFIKEKKCQ